MTDFTPLAAAMAAVPADVEMLNYQPAPFTERSRWTVWLKGWAKAGNDVSHRGMGATFDAALEAARASVAKADAAAAERAAAEATLAAAGITGFKLVAAA